jgi:Fic family protein
MKKTTKLETLVIMYKVTKEGDFDLQKQTSFFVTLHSTGMDGSTLTRDEVFDLLDFCILAKDKPVFEQQMVLDYHKALTFTLNEARRQKPLTETFIHQVGALVAKNTGIKSKSVFHIFDSTKGDYRFLSLFIGAHSFPRGEKIPALMKELISDVNAGLESAQTFNQKCELAFEFFYRLLTIRPYADANDRTCILLMNYILAWFDLPIFYIFKNRKDALFQAFEGTYRSNDMSIFFDFMYMQYRRFIRADLRVNEE